MKKVIISGASGFIGQALAEALLADGVEVYGLCATPEKLGELKKNPHFHLIQIEFQEYEQLAQKVSERDFDVFFHFAWQGYGKATNDYRVQISNIPVMLLMEQSNFVVNGLFLPTPAMNI